MEKLIKTDICVIGAGSGGLSVAAVASQMGANVVLIEKGKMGGDCLNYGCVPSKSILAAAKRAKMIREAHLFGIQSSNLDVDFSKVYEHVHDVISTIAPNDSVERFEKLGVKVIKGHAKFLDPHHVGVNQQAIKAKYFIIATGSSPAAPPIPGLEEVNYLTNETIFDLKEKPEKLIVIGGGPIGCELSQAFSLLGTPVVLLEAFTILPKDDSELVDVVRKELVKNKLELYEKVKVINVSQSSDRFSVVIEVNGHQNTIEGSHLLVSAGRKPNLENLGLEKANVEYSKKGVKVDSRLRTTQKHIYAVGDAAGSYQFTHAASYHAGIVIRNCLFHLPAKINDMMPWVTYTDPELAHVGLNEAMAKQKKMKYQVLKFPFNDIDRAWTEKDTTGLIKIIVAPNGKILGASIVGAEAGELILPWVLALQQKLKISALASMIVPYPTRNEISKRAAGEFYKPKLFSDRMQKIVRFLLKF